MKDVINTPPMRVLQVVNGMNRGGAETLIMNFYRAIDRTKVQFDFLVHTKMHCDFDDEIQSLGGRIFSLPRYRIINHIAYRDTVNTFFRAHPEICIVHGHQYSIASVYLKAAKKNGRITIAHSHSTSNGQGLSATIKNVYQKSLPKVADYCFACSQAAGEWLYQGKREFRIIPNAITLEQYCFSSEKRQAVRNELDLPEDAFVVGHVGRFNQPKNHPFLLEIFAALLQKAPQARLLLVGEGSDRPVIEQRARELNVMGQALFLGKRQDVSDLMQAMDVFCLPSFFEGFPVVGVEAQAAGLPCIISDTVTPEIKLTPEVKMLSLTQSASLWAEEILLFKNKERRDNFQRLSDAGYNIKSAAQELETFYLKQDVTLSRSYA